LEAQGVGTYNFSGGVIEGDWDLVCGWCGIGTFNHTGGTATYWDIVLGANEASHGQYTLFARWVRRPTAQRTYLAL
jgi:hypothetical protein